MDEQTSSRELSAPLSASVLIITWNRPEAFRRCLSSLADQTCSWEACEIVVLDVSDQDVESIAASFADVLPIRYHRARNEGVAANRNAIARLASGELLLFIDDDCVASSGWMDALRTALSRDPSALVAALTEEGASDNIFVAAGQVITDLVNDFFNRPEAPARFVPGLNFGLERDRFFASGGFDGFFRGVASEDRDYAYRWLRSGGRIEIVNGAKVRHDHRMTLSGFVRQYVSYGRGAWRFHRKWRHASGQPSTMRDLGLHAYVLMRLPRLLAETPSRRRLQLLALLFLWQISNAIGFAGEAVADGVRRLLRLGSP